MKTELTPLTDKKSEYPLIERAEACLEGGVVHSVVDFFFNLINCLECCFWFVEQTENLLGLDEYEITL